MVYVRPVFIRHPEPAIGSERQAFAVNGNMSPAGSRAAKPITCKGSNGQDWEAGICDRPKDVGVKAGCRGAIGTGEEDGVLVGELEVWSRWICKGSVRLGRQGDGEFVDAVLVIESSFRVPTSPVSTPSSCAKRLPTTYQPLSGMAHNNPV